MTTQEAIAGVRYVVNSKGERTDVVISWDAWQQILADWQAAIEQMEDQEDVAIFAGWLERNRSGTEDRISIEELELELITDGLLPG